MFEKLFEPGKIGTMELKNRIVMMPMGNGYMESPDGGFSQRTRDYFEARARGGTGLIMTGSTVMTRVTESEGRKSISTLFLDHTYVGGASETCDAVHRHGAKICIQLTAGDGRLWTWGPTPLSASDGLPSVFDANVKSRAATTGEVEKIIEDWGIVAGLCKTAGFDAIEIRAYGGYFTDQFMTALWNHRTDRFGGDLAGRMRYPMEIIKVIRKACGDDYPIVFKFTPDHGFEGGRTIEEGIRIARMVQDAGVDALHIDYGSWENHYVVIPPVHQPFANQIWLAERIRQVVDIPVIAHGKLGNKPEIAEQVLREGKTDYVGLGRSLLADPEWANKVREGRLADIKPCIGCQKGCLGRIFEGKYVSCAVNPQTGMERDFRLTPAERKKTVLVVGGGPGGAEAARVAAVRGHDVTLCDKNPTLGGQIRAASVHGVKEQLHLLADYYSVQLAKTGVKVELGKAMDAAEVARRKPDVVILATGATPILPVPEGADRPDNAYTVEDVLLDRGQIDLGSKVVVVGGGEMGCEIALHLVQKHRGLSVTLVEQFGELATNAFHSTRLLLKKRVEESGITVMFNTRLAEVGKGKVTVEAGDKRKSVDADAVVFAVGYRSNEVLAEALRGAVPELYTIGDCNKPRQVLGAVWEGFHAARVL
jgi:2-enoate reductase